jgi:hypothetical protein
MKILRLVLGWILGVAFGLGVVIAGDAINHTMFPPPPEQWADYARSAPFYALLGLPIAYTIAAFIAAFAGAKFAALKWVGWSAGGVLTAATFANLLLIPHPVWMTVACVVCVPMAAWLGGKLSGPPTQTFKVRAHVEPSTPTV